MSVIHVCSLKSVEDLANAVGPSHVLSLLGGVTPFPPTPHGVDPANHLKITVADIAAPEEGMITPGADHVAEVIAFGRRWYAETRGQRSLLVHCFAGISRSTASTLAIACSLRPEVDESIFAFALRRASAAAQPNRLMVRHADELLQREGRLIEAVEAIGEGDFSQAGRPYMLRLDV